MPTVPRHGPSHPLVALCCPTPRLLGLLLSLSLAAPSFAGPQSYLVKDINPTGSSNPADMVLSRNRILFAADDGSTGRELWVTDGSEAGTNEVIDIYPGLVGSDPQELLDINGKLFFGARGKDKGRELWIDDGVSTSTNSIHRVKDIYPGSGNSNPNTLTNLGGTLIFRADDEIHGSEPWRSDGTAAGTTLIADLKVGSGGSYVQQLTPVGSTLLFRCDQRDGLHGMELWSSDGTTSHTAMVKDINPGPGGSYPLHLTNLNGTLLFRANDGGTFKKGYELWKSDATSNGTVRVKDIWTGDPGSDPAELLNVNGVLFFNADDGIHGRELWKSRATDASTILVKDLLPGTGSSIPHRLFGIGGKVFFQANETNTSYELWVSDGTDTGTLPLHVFAKDPAGTEADTFAQVNVQDFLVFPAYDPAHGTELWRSNGTSEGTVRLTDDAPGPASANPTPLYVANTTLLYAAAEGVHGREQWRLAHDPDAATDPGSLLEFVFGALGTPVLLEVVVRNDGFAPLTFVDPKVSLTGPNVYEFSIVSPALPTSLAPGATVLVQIKFTPLFGAEKYASLVVSTNDPDHPELTLPIRGHYRPLRGMMLY